MSFDDCIRGHIGEAMDERKKGAIPQAKAKEIIEEYQRLLERYTETLGDEAAAHRAAEHYTNIMHKVIAKRIQNDINHVLAQRRVTSSLNSRIAEISADKQTGKMKWIHGHPTARATREFLEKSYTRSQSIMNMATKMIADEIEAYRTKAGGFKQDVDGFVDVVREMGGISTGSKDAAAAGKAIRGTFDMLHKMFEDQGGIIGKVDNYFPQIHTPELVARSTFEEWRDFILPKLDREKMIDPDTALPMDHKRLNEALKHAYDSIRTNGLIEVAEKAKAGKQRFGRGGDINQRQASSRFLHFKDIDAFLEYNREFGVRDSGLFDAMMHHIEAMSRDIGLMQIMGPKPNAIMANLELKLQGDGANPMSINVIKGMYDTAAGKNSYHGELPHLYKYTAGWINLKRAAYLGSAPISALSDTFFIGMTARLNGLEATKVMSKYYKALNPANAEDRRIMRRHVFVAGAANGMSLQGARISDDLGRGGITQFLAGATNRLSGLQAMTDIGRSAIVMELAGVLAEARIKGQAFDAIDPALRQAAEMYGITAKDWDIMLKSKPSYIDEVDSEFMFAEDIAGLGDEGLDVSIKFQDWFTKMSMEALNEPSLTTRSITTGAIVGDARAGTINRLIFSNIFFAKSFPVTVMINHLIPSMRQAAHGRGGRLAATVIGSTIFGAMALQARQVIQGKDPRDIDDPAFWVSSMLQGGGLGLFGDFMFADYNRFGTSLGGSMAGPVIGSLEGLVKLGDLDSLGEDADLDKMMRDTWRLVNREIPTVRLWYTRMIVERMLFDQVEKMIDPSYNKRMRRIEKRMKTQTGQGFWWKPAEALPRRAPEILGD